MWSVGCELCYCHVGQIFYGNGTSNFPRTKMISCVTSNVPARENTPKKKKGKKKRFPYCIVSYYPGKILGLIYVLANVLLTAHLSQEKTDIPYLLTSAIKKFN